MGETCPCNFHPSGWLQAGALTFRLISLVAVKWSCLRINKQAILPKQALLDLRTRLYAFNRNAEELTDDGELRTLVEVINPSFR